MGRITLIIFVAVTMLLVVPMPVQAAPCEGFLCNVFGSFERQEMRNATQIEMARIEQARQAEVARIEGEAAERVEQAKAQLAREVAAGQIAQAEAEAQAQMFEALVSANTQTAVRQIELEYESQAGLIMQQTQIALAGVAEAGQTERWRIGLDAAVIALVVLVVSGLAAYIMRRQQAPAQPPVMVLPPGHRFPALPRGDVYELPGTVDVEYPPARWGGER